MRSAPAFTPVPAESPVGKNADTRIDYSDRMIIQLTSFPRFTPARSGGYPRVEFHILGAIRKKYKLDESLYSSSGNVIFPNYHAVRICAQKLNAGRDLISHPERAVKAGQLNAMALIDEIYHYLLRVYEERVNPKVFERALNYLDREIGPEMNTHTISEFTSLYPPVDVFTGRKSPVEYLATTSAGKPHTEIALEEMILLYFANINPAAVLFKELFDDRELSERSAYSPSIEQLEVFFQTEKPFGPKGQYIFDLLMAPILASPNSLEGQLAFMREHWGLILSETYLQKILGARDLSEEDMRLIFPGGGLAPAVVPTFERDEFGALDQVDVERFTADLEWMPKVIILAKNTYVWLDQLSRKYQRPISKLNEIPDEELDQLARWNFTGLWLIGVWERSHASQRIKQLMGNPEAVSSAYSVYDYEIAADLGGEEALKNLRHRAWERGIRLAGDMVPNHMGMYSRWIVEKPEYFIQSTYSPFPNYRFTGPNLSEDSSVDLRIEDGYWSHSDAAVVFQHVDNTNGSVRFIYHGNDGTNMPWNDTAQLDFLKAEVREAVIQTIFHVARKFSVIRFDAAMVLAKKHFQRLWYPESGTGGAIPSRADHAMSKAEFERIFPVEFWREVVDRINAEMPNTLLLAEAFWLLEGYFVRTLGMHRVYNSAFMHMLMKEENSKYRELIRNTMHYNPEILKRYVNFMSNPDEQTAVAQFGKDDKYFGVAMMMLTLPGLPMFAHGQIEGYSEKYGMEYRRAYYDERPDLHLVWRHEQEIFPLMGRRHLFSQVIDFELYDFVATDGHLNENVFAYSNRSGDDRSLICYHNKYEETSGWIRNSVGRNIGSTDEPRIVHKHLAEALGLRWEDGYFYTFRDSHSNLEFIRSGKELHERGLFVELRAFQYQVFLDFREIYDHDGSYASLTNGLQGKGVHRIDEALQAMRLTPVWDAFRTLLSEEMLAEVMDSVFSSRKTTQSSKQFHARILDAYETFVHEIDLTAHVSLNTEMYRAELRTSLEAMRSIIDQVDAAKKLPVPKRKHFAPDSSADMFIKPAENRRDALILLGILLTTPFASVKNGEMFDELQLGRILSESAELHQLSSDRETIASIVRVIVSLCPLLTQGEKSFGNRALLTMLDLPVVHAFLNVHAYEGICYYNKERFDELTRWLLVVALIVSERRSEKESDTKLNIVEAMKSWQELRSMSEQSHYKIDVVRELISLNTKQSMLTV